MAIKQEELDKAHEILRQFERKDIDHSEFCWKYITDRVNASKTSLWRNTDFKEEFERIKMLMKAYAKKQKSFNHETIKKSHDEAKIARLEREVIELKAQLHRERERLAYAQMIARQNGLDPLEFMESSPLNLGIVSK